jgi:ankyrin repeat protein
MPDRELPARPSLEQYKKQAKDLLHDQGLGTPAALIRIAHHHPRLQKLSEPDIRSAPFTLSDAQLILAREHGFESWPKFASHIRAIHLINSVADLPDPVVAFIEVACVPCHSGHASGDLEHAQLILARYPQVVTANIYTAAILADESTVRSILLRDPKSATAKGGPHNWDALTHLCFSRYVRLDSARSAAFVRTAQALLDAGASANTGWYEMIDYPTPRPTFESAIYGAAGIAHHAELTRLLLARGADPNDEETPYHVPEGYDNTVTQILLESGKLNPASVATMLLRKCDWHDEKGLQLILEHGADPNAMTRWGLTALHQSLRRDNGLIMIELLLDHGANPALPNREGRSATQIAAHRGRADALRLFHQRNIPPNLEGLDQLIAACALADRESIQTLTTQHPHLIAELLAQGGTLLAEFAGNANVEGIHCLLELGVSPASLYGGDGYFDIAKDSTALHIAAWRAWPAAVKALIARGAPINALDAKGRTALALAVKACTDSYWKYRRTTESIEALLNAGASVAGINLPTGYDEADRLLSQATG